MKVEFEIEESEANLLASSLKNIIGQSSSSETIKSLNKIVLAIEADIKIGVEVFNQLKYYLKDYTNGNSILKDSNLVYDLGMSQVFISSINGLELKANQVLMNLLNTYKKNGHFSRITANEMSRCKTINDIIKVIQEKYEKA